MEPIALGGTVHWNLHWIKRIVELMLDKGVYVEVQAERYSRALAMA